MLHPEVSLPVTVNVARSVQEAEKQARGERVGQDNDDEEAAADAEIAELFEAGQAEAAADRTSERE